MKIRLIALCVVALGVGGLVACGDDDGGAGIQIQSDADGLVGDTDENASTDTDTDTDEGANDDADAGSAEPANGATGSAVAVIGGETFEFSQVECLFGADTGRVDDGILAMRGAGEGGLTLFASSTSSDPDDADADPFDAVDIQGADFSLNAVNVPAAGQPGFLEIEGTSISATTEFFDERIDDFVDGTFDATCP